MTDAAPENTAHPPPTVFLSYATEDRPAARSIREALQGLGVEVWYDESALDGGDAWDQKIRRQIRACDFFMPVISAQTAARPEGYFRREWRLAVERTLDMADDHLFLLPVIIDDTSEAGARVPEKFLAVQWTRVPGGHPNAALEGLARRVVSGQGAVPKSPASTRPAAPRTEGRRPKGSGPPPTPPELPEFPRQEPGQKIRFLFQVLGWTLQSGWIFFRRFPRWIRIIVYLWLAVLILSSRACIPSSEEHHSEKLSRADAEKLKAIAQGWQGSSGKSDVGKLGAQIAQAFSEEVAGQSQAAQPMLAVPFGAPAGDAAAAKLADSTFAEVYGRIAIAHHGHVGLTEAALPDTTAAVQSGREHHARYVLYGGVDKAAQNLTVSILKVKDASVLWSASYAVAGADPAAIAGQVAAQIPDLEDD